jgi:predicted metal-dependent phosphoesterase TrpH
VSVDLHLHSSRSDGSDEPAEIVAHAVAAGLTAIALTDHDNLNGIVEARAAATQAGIHFISGTELSVNWRSGGMHMLVYFLEPGEGPLQDALSGLQRGREARNREMAQQLSGLGLAIDYDEVIDEAGGSGVGRPHFAAVLVRKGYVRDIKEAFDMYLADGRPGYVPRRRLDASRAIDLARASGAVPVIAHPHTVGVSADEYRSAFEELVDAGLGGIEAFYAEYEQSQRSHLAGICHRLGIVPTGGSDYHGSYKAGLSVGTGRGDLEVPDETVDLLEQQRQAG